jgi:hypothetical protein
MWPSFPALIYLIVNLARNFARTLLDSWVDDLGHIASHPTSRDAATRAVASLDDEIGEGELEGPTRHELIADTKSPRPDQIALDRITADDAVPTLEREARAAGMSEPHVAGLVGTAQGALSGVSAPVPPKERMRRHRFRRSAAAQQLRQRPVLRELLATS